MTEERAHARRGEKPGLPEIDVHEYGGKRDGVQQKLDRRLFMQLLVFDVPPGDDPEEAATALEAGLEEAGVAGVVYEDANAPLGLGLLTWAEDAAYFVKNVRPVFRRPTLRRLLQRRDHTMLGRTYSLGYEPDLEHVLLRRSVDNVVDPEWPWHVWYPLRRSGAFAALDRQERNGILKEHGAIGRAYGEKNLAHDVRLACHGLDAEDNEFVIGLIGQRLHPLSHVVQTMRSTRQTREFIVKMGPFFTGYARWQSRGRGGEGED
jgi:hypothetical protein